MQFLHANLFNLTYKMNMCTHFLICTIFSRSAVTRDGDRRKTLSCIIRSRLNHKQNKASRTAVPFSLKPRSSPSREFLFLECFVVRSHSCDNFKTVVGLVMIFYHGGQFWLLEEKSINFLRR